MSILGEALPFFTSAAVLMNVLGVLLGLVIGAIPGLGPVVALVLATPITFGMDPGHALVFLLAVYVGSISGGGISSVLLNVPGTVGSISTAFDGFPMSKKGRAREALAICITSSAVGALVGGAVFVLLGPYIGEVSSLLGPAEYTLLIVIAFILVAAASQGDGIKALLMAVTGLLISFVGRDVSTGTPRFTGGLLSLQDGISFSVAVIGLFAMGQVFASAGKTRVSSGVSALSGSTFGGVTSTLRNVGTAGRSSLLGAVLGLIPGIGITLSGLLGWAFQRKLDRSPRVAYGEGNPRGVIASETGNNASATSSLPLTFGLGIPGGAADAVLLGGLLLYGLRTGPSFFSGDSAVFPVLAWGVLTAPFVILASLLIVRYLARLTVVPYRFLVPVLAVLSVIGAFATRGQMFDVWVMLAFGVFGHFLTKGGFPLHNLVIGMILGPLLEQNFNRALVVSGGSADIFWDGLPAQILITVCVLGLVALILPASLLSRLRKKSKDGDASDETADDQRVIR